MANTTFNTRIKLKYDTLANWTTNEAKVLLAGEVGLCYVPSVTSELLQLPLPSYLRSAMVQRLGENYLGVPVLPRTFMIGLKLLQNHLMIIVRLKILPL